MCSCRAAVFALGPVRAREPPTPQLTAPPKMLGVTHWSSRLLAQGLKVGALAKGSPSCPSTLMAENRPIGWHVLAVRI